LDSSIWDDWLKVRTTKKLPLLTKSIMARIHREAEKAGLTLSGAITLAAEKSWGGFEADWLNEKKQTYPKKSQSTKLGASYAPDTL
jgi:hypothetical protein